MIGSLFSEPTWFHLTVVAVATWRLAYMLIAERGPFDLLTRIRRARGVVHDDSNEPVGWPDNSIFACLYCMSFWMGLILAILPWWVSVPFAMSALAIGYDSVVARLNRRDG